MTRVTESVSTGRGSLRVYLGAAPGVGKTYAMLNEGRRRLHRGADVVVGLVETHDRPITADAVADLEVVPRQVLEHRGAVLTDMDVDAVLARKPKVALVDELAHTNVPGCRNGKRWQDVEELLAAGIDVITTVNIQHLESLNDVVFNITGVRQAETVPDEVVRQADQIELVDMSPQALRRRMAHGNIYKPEKVDAALTNYFRVGNLTALRELALLWTADRVDQALELYREQHDIEQPWPARERVVVALTGGPEGETLIRRGARIFQRAVGGELVALHVTTTDGLSGGSPDALERQRRLVEELGGSYQVVTGNDVGDAILDFARGVNATQIVLGAPRRGRIAAALSEGIGSKVVRDSGEIDVHIVTHEGSRSRALPSLGKSPISRDRQVLAWLGALVGIPVLAWLLIRTGREDLLPVTLMLFMLAVLIVSLIGGMWPALAGAAVAALIVDYFYFPPYNTFRITSTANLVAMILLLVAAVLAARVVDVSAKRLRQAAAAKAEADTLATLTGTIMRGEQAIPALLNQLQTTFSLDYVALREREERTKRWRVRESVGQAPSAGEPTTDISISDDLVMVISGGSLDAANMRVLTAVAVQAQELVERDRLRTEARIARQERERTRIRTALLAAVSHDLRTPLAGTKAAITALRSSGLALDDQDREVLLETVETSTDRLQSLIDNLLDMSRLDAGAVVPVTSEVWIPDLLAAAGKSVDPDGLSVEVPVDLPPVWGDEGLLERALANVIENAARYSPVDRPVRVSAEATGSEVLVRVADEGPGVPDAEKVTMFQPFQRLGDAPGRQGVGLGLAVAKGFVEACGGRMEAEDTPGGGLTMLFWLPTGGPNA